MPMSEREVTAMNKRNDVKMDANGIKIIKTHHGQRRAYGDTTYEYRLIFNGAITDEAAMAAFQSVAPCALDVEKWRSESSQSMEKHFRRYFQMKRVSPGCLDYIITSPYTG